MLQQRPSTVYVTLQSLPLVCSPSILITFMANDEELLDDSIFHLDVDSSEG